MYRHLPYFAVISVLATNSYYYGLVAGIALSARSREGTQGVLLAGALWMLVGTPIANGPFIYAVSDGVDAPPASMCQSGGC